MFAAYCTTHETEVLLTERRITRIRVEEDSVEVSFTCWCGTEGSFSDPRITVQPAAATGGSAAHLTGSPDHVLGRRQLA
jgi:hypothetical protein